MAELAELFTTFEQRLPTDVVPLAGPDEVETQRAAPSISWEPFVASHQPGQHLGGGRKGPEGALWTRHLTVNVRIWGRTHAETEELLVSFVNAVHATLSHAGYQLGGEIWSRSGPGMSSGFEVVLALVLVLPLPRQTSARRPLSEIDPTFKLNETEV